MITNDGSNLIVRYKTFLQKKMFYYEFTNSWTYWNKYKIFKIVIYRKNLQKKYVFLI